MRHDRRERDDDVGHNVGEHDVIMRFELFHHGGVADDIAGERGEAVGKDLVDGGILPGDVLGLGVDVDAGGVAGPEEERRDGEDAGAGRRRGCPGFRG